MKRISASNQESQRSICVDVRTIRSPTKGNISPVCETTPEILSIGVPSSFLTNIILPILANKRCTWG